MLNIIDELIKHKRILAAYSFILNEDNEIHRETVANFIVHSEIIASEMRVSLNTELANYAINKLNGIVALKIEDLVPSNVVQELVISVVERNRKVELNSLRTLLVETDLTQIDSSSLFLLGELIGHDLGVPLDSLSTDNLRRFAESYAEKKLYDKARVVMLKLIDKLKFSFWEWHFIGKQEESLGNIENALVSYKKFMKVAEDKNKIIAIVEGAKRILQCIKLSSLDIEYGKFILSKIPKEHVARAELEGELEEINRVISYKEHARTNLSSPHKVIGHHFMSRNEISTKVKELLVQLSLHPNHNDFFELHKAYTLLGDVPKAQESLINARNLNALLFSSKAI